MKKIFLVQFTVLCILNAFAQDEPYRGGNSDGHATNGIVNPLDEPIAFQAFKGGIADGHATDSVVNLVFAYPPHFYAYLGGETDGWAGTLISTVVLPIEISQFTGYKNGKYNELQWTTVLEQNSAHFVIERSKNAVLFDSLGSVSASGNSNSLKNYRFTDIAPVSGNNFYRIKLVDTDGSYKYSHTILLKNDGASIKINAYPNPVKDIVQLQLPQAYGLAVPCIIYDMNGKIVFNGFIPAGYAQYMFNISKLPGGYYLLKLHLPDTVTSVLLSK